MKTRAKKKLVPTKPSFANERALIDVVQEVDQMDLEEKMKERPKMTHIDAPGVRYISTETMERMTRVFPSTKVRTDFMFLCYSLLTPYYSELHSDLWKRSFKGA